MARDKENFKRWKFKNKDKLKDYAKEWWAKNGSKYYKYEKKGYRSWNKGKAGVYSNVTLKKMSNAKKGENHWHWRGGITSENKRLKKSLEYRKWREAVFARDNFTCQFCGIRGCYLEPHHIRGFAEYPELRFVVENGITLCENCHKLTDNYKKKVTI